MQTERWLLRHDVEYLLSTVQQRLSFYICSSTRAYGLPLNAYSVHILMLTSKIRHSTIGNYSFWLRPTSLKLPRSSSTTTVDYVPDFMARKKYIIRPLTTNDEVFQEYIHRLLPQKERGEKRIVEQLFAFNEQIDHFIQNLTIHSILSPGSLPCYSSTSLLSPPS